MADLLNKVTTGLSAAGSIVNAAEGLLGAGQDGGSSKFAVSKLNAEILSKKKGLYKPNLYLVRIAPISAPQRIKSTDLEFLCNSANLPGRTFAPQEYKRYGYGLRDMRISDGRVNDINLSFFVDGDGYTLQYFNEWFESIMNQDYQKGTGATNNAGLVPGTFNYKSEYSTTIDIHTFDPTANEILSYKCHEAFPLQMTDVAVAWAGQDSFESLAVSFSYKYYTLSKAPAPTVGGNPAGLLTSIKNGIGTATRFLNSPAVRNTTAVLSAARGNGLF